jgi:hypothetical protein
MATGTAVRRQFQSLFSRVIPAKLTVDPAAFVDDESQEINLTVPGAQIGDFVLVAPGVDITEATVSATVTAANTVTVVLSMTGGDTNNVASSSWNILVLGPDSNLFK